MIQAFHSSAIFLEEGQIIYGGMPAGYMIQAEGLTLLHAGDTALFSDMKMIGNRNKIDIAFLPIGDHYTMGPDDALQAAEWFGAKLVIPVHYDPARTPKHSSGAWRPKASKGEFSHQVRC